MVRHDQSDARCRDGSQPRRATRVSRHRHERGSVPSPFCTASDRRSITTCTCEPRATDGVFVPAGDGPAAFLPARPITQADLAALTEKVRRRVVRWFRIQRFLDADAAADMSRSRSGCLKVDSHRRGQRFESHALRSRPAPETAPFPEENLGVEQTKGSNQSHGERRNSLSGSSPRFNRPGREAKAGLRIGRPRRHGCRGCRKRCRVV